MRTEYGPGKTLYVDTFYAVKLYRKTMNKGHTLYRVTRIFGRGYTRGMLIFGWPFIRYHFFASQVFYTCYLCLKKEDWNKTKKQCSCSKMPFYYLAANKTRDFFHNSGPLISIRLGST